MSYQLTWLADVLRKADLKVVEQGGWKERGIGDIKRPIFVVCHHTATTNLKDNMPSLNALIHGRPKTPTSKGLRGPLAQLGIARDGTFYVIAAGLCHHAGESAFGGYKSLNSWSIGIEPENNGLGEPWSEVLMDAYARGCAALLKHIKKPVTNCIGHKECCVPPGRKIDPSFDMKEFRERVAGHM